MRKCVLGLSQPLRSVSPQHLLTSVGRYASGHGINQACVLSLVDFSRPGVPLHDI